MNKSNQPNKADESKTNKSNLSIWQRIVNNREWLLLISAILGIVLAFLWFSDRECSVSWFFFEEIASYNKFISIEQGKWLDIGLITLLLVLLLLLFLRLFRIIIKKIKSINQWLLDNRLLSLILAALFGILLGGCWVTWNGCFPLTTVNLKESIGIFEDNKGSDLDLSLITLLLVLPTLLLLWIFRTFDTREQIKTTQNNTLTSMLTHALDMITSNDLKRRAMGLIQLAQLKKQTKDFDAQIDASTRHLDLSTVVSKGASLSKSASPLEHKSSLFMDSTLENMDLRGTNFRDGNLIRANLSSAILFDANLSSAKLNSANLSGANLFFAKLVSANLSDANLVGAQLSNAKLNGAYLRGANLSDANLRGADLRSAQLSDRTDLLEAKYDDETLFPEGFDPETKGMVKVLKSRFGI